MHPAKSVILFTVLSGAGFGLMAILGLGLFMPGGAVAAFFISLLAGALAVGGLLASTFHLGHPERAIKAFSQWRSSWLSREGVAAVATLILFAIYSLLWMATGERNPVLGLLVTLGALATIYATSMIYAQLKTVPIWNTPLTSGCYLGFCLMQGLTIAAFLASFSSQQPGWAMALLIVAILVTCALKVAWWNRVDDDPMKQAGYNTAAATGLANGNGKAKVRLLEKPHSGENYLTREMMFRVARKHARKLRMISLMATFGLPLVFVLLAVMAGAPIFFLILAMISQFIGLFAERWLFFAEAKHVVSLYYQ